jgi:predicted nucleic-acid-binding protein
MLAIDTNIVVRYLTGDDRRQAARARRLIERSRVHVSITVLLESEWVLRSVYGFERDRLARVLTAFAGLPTVSLEDPPLAATALTWVGQGMDFADALHLAKSEGCDGFITFDERLVKAARALGVKARTP